MNKGLLTGTGVAVLAAFSLVWAASPVFAGQALIRAAKAGDEARLEQLVDFPALRQSMKDEFNAELVARMRRDPRVVESGLGGIGLMLAPMLLAGAVDAVVTPQGVAAMVSSGEAPDPTDDRRPAPSSGDEEEDIHQSWGYRDLNTFAITLTQRDQPDEHLALLLKRRGPFGWRLAGVDMQSDGAG
jgi:hypothetical protein